MVTTRAFALRDAGERHACQMLFEGGRFRCRPPFLFCTQKDLHDLLNLSFRAGLLCSCASRSRTYDGGVKVPCLTAWRWRIMQNSIAYFPLFHKRCAAFLQLFLCAVCRTCGGLGRFLGFAAGTLRFPYPSMFLRKASFAGCVFQKTQSAGGTRFILQR